jgi:hypothetical protein
MKETNTKKKRKSKMLTIKNGRFSDCVFLEDLKDKKIEIKTYCNKEINWVGNIVKISKDSQGGYSVIVNNWDDGLVGYRLHNIEYASIV